MPVEPEEHPGAPSQPTGAPRAKILVVDDEEDVLRSTEMQLESLGYQAIATSEPGSVIEIAERERPGLILQDLRMPGLNLAGLMASLRSNPATEEIPIVFFSAHMDVDQMAAKYDAWGFLRKPFTEKELVQILEKALGGWPHERRLTTRDPVHRDIMSVFHDYWNLISALNSYTETLLRSPSLREGDREIVKGQQEVLMKLEFKTDRLRSYLQAVIAQAPASAGGEKRPGASKSPSPTELAREES